jgi:hypothetical protein
MKVKKLINFLLRMDAETEICVCDINGDIECVEGLSNRHKEVYLVREAKPWDQGEDYYEYWTLSPKGKKVLDTKKVFLLW